MNSRTNTFLAWLFASVIACGIAYYALVLNHEKEAKQKAYHVTENAAVEKRFNEWAYVAKEKAVSKTETVKLLVVPSKLGNDDLFDSKCLIYTNTEFRTSTMLCPGVTSDDLDVPE